MMKTALSSFVWTKHRNVTDGQTDQPTASPWLLQRSALRAMRTRCKNRPRASQTDCHVCTLHTINLLYIHCCRKMLCLRLKMRMLCSFLFLLLIIIPLSHCNNDDFSSLETSAIDFDFDTMCRMVYSAFQLAVDILEPFQISSRLCRLSRT